MTGHLPFAGVLLLAFTSGLQGQTSGRSQRQIDLEKIGYPAQAHCDYMFQDKDAYAKRHVEFLDSEHLLVSFPLRSSPCDKYGQPTANKFRSVIIDTTGTPLHSFDWSPREDVQAGPDGHILMSSGWEICLLDADFSTLQRIEWPKGQGPQSKMTTWTGRLINAPSRRGFVATDAYAPNHTAYFEGTPARQTASVDTCWSLAVTDGGFACLDRSKQQLDIHLSDGERSVRAPALGKAAALLLPDPQTVLILTDKHRLDQVDPSGADQEIADLHWLVPGWNSGFRWDLASGAARRVLFFSHGARFPITDSSGFGYYLRVAVVDIGSKSIVFRKQYPIDSDVAISPDGRTLAVRRKADLTLIDLP
ncbi:exported hypothetical protein [Candidatus Sulfotelmatobacter kueseliae]|uniref:Uncharacterized protein n=1 Tax=Candidatus Sulfotelmatobacter kueseliae TaxID=2042962 RepID=A0A2U3KNV0_9BACT|nr:exported hypothetical protein [Candidatus Sulfotelmatobacter kueseliae]